MGVGGQHQAPAALPLRKTRYPLYRRLGGFQGRSGRVRKISPPTGIRPPDRPARSESLYLLSYPGRSSLQGIGIQIFVSSVYMSVHLTNVHHSEKIFYKLETKLLSLQASSIYTLLIPAISSNTDRAPRQTCKAEAVDKISDITYDKVLVNYHITFTAFLLCNAQQRYWDDTKSVFSLRLILSQHSGFHMYHLLLHFKNLTFLTRCAYEFLIFVNSNYFPKQYQQVGLYNGDVSFVNYKLITMHLNLRHMMFCTKNSNEHTSEDFHTL